MEGYTIVTDAEATLDISSHTGCCPSAVLGSEGVQFAVLAEVLSGAMIYTISGPTATPDHGDHRLAIGDTVFVDPARNLRWRMDGTGGCVKLQAFRRH